MCFKLNDFKPEDDFADLVHETLPCLRDDCSLADGSVPHGLCSAEADGAILLLRQSCLDLGACRTECFPRALSIPGRYFEAFAHLLPRRHPHRTERPRQVPQTPWPNLGIFFLAVEEICIVSGRRFAPS